jgi:hypothetical protein
LLHQWNAIQPKLVLILAANTIQYSRPAAIECRCLRRLGDAALLGHARADYPFEDSVEAGHWMDDVAIDESLRTDIAYNNAAKLLSSFVS